METPKILALLSMLVVQLLCLVAELTLYLVMSSVAYRNAFTRKVLDLVSKLLTYLVSFP